MLKTMSYAFFGIYICNTNLLDELKLHFRSAIVNGREVSFNKLHKYYMSGETATLMCNSFTTWCDKGEFVIDPIVEDSDDLWEKIICEDCLCGVKNKYNFSTSTCCGYGTISYGVTVNDFDKHFQREINVKIFEQLTTVKEELIIDHPDLADRLKIGLGLGTL